MTASVRYRGLECLQAFMTLTDICQVPSGDETAEMDGGHFVPAVHLPIDTSSDTHAMSAHEGSVDTQPPSWASARSTA